MFDPKGPVAQQLAPLLVTELSVKYNIPDDAKDLAEYIIMLIGNGRPANEIVAETKEIVNIPIDEAFIGTIFAEIGRLETLHAEAAAAQNAAQNAAQQMPVESAPEPMAQESQNEIPNLPRGPSSMKRLPKGPEGFKAGGLNKSRANGRKGGKDFVSKNVSRKDVPLRVKGQRPAIQEKLLEQISQHMPGLLAKAPHQLSPSVQVCKFGVICGKELCPFGHPTPANKDAKVTNPRWCRFNKECTNERCNYAHSSPNYQAPAVQNKQARATPTSLEQCKFNKACTNKFCPKRHSTSSVACQRGMNCKVPFCTFNHIINEDCRHGNDCTNKICYFKHPDGREMELLRSNTGPSSNTSTSERTFAVADDQVMEQAVQ